MQSHAKALRNQVAETSRSCSFPPSPPTPLHPRRGDQGSSTAIFGQRFVRGGVHAQTPTFKRVGNQRPRKRVDAACVHFEGWPGTENFTPLKTRPHAAVEGQFEGWRLTVNSITSNTRPHRAVELPFLARRGERGVGGESGGCSARIATSLIAACAGTARATVRKHPQSETHGVALKPPAWRLCKCHSHTARYQVVTGRVVRGQGVSRGRDNSASHSGTALAKSKWSMADCNGFKGSPGAPSYPCCTSSMA